MEDSAQLNVSPELSFRESQTQLNEKIFKAFFEYIVQCRDNGSIRYILPAKANAYDVQIEIERAIMRHIENAR